MHSISPQIFTRTDKHNRPYTALIVAPVFGVLAYVSHAPEGSVTFGWLLALSSLSFVLTSVSICIVNIYFRRV